MTHNDLLPLDLGSGLILTATVAADAPEAFSVINAERGRLREWLPWVDDTTSLALEREYLARIERGNAIGSALHATIRLDSRFCGFVGLRFDLLHRSAEIGYWLAEHAVGAGVMTRSVAAMIDVAFGPFELHRVELLAATGNTGSRSIAERLGMTLEGVRREAEELASGFVDLAMYAVLVHDWPGASVALAEAARRTETR